jgi:arylsulfatase A-like enzyme/Flp pilus assembly protein TadD
LDALATIAAAAALWTAACAQPNRDFPRQSNRNILLITIDTLRADALGAGGGPARTPNLDRLAADGVRFSFAHAHAVVTLPSHASILTGRYPFEHGYRDNSGFRLASGVDTLAMRLKRSGFATAAFIGAFPLDGRFGLTPGFDVYDGRFDDSGAGVAFILPERPAAVVADRAAAWIRAQPARWFAWVHVYEPHAPYRPPPPFDREYASQPYYGEVAAADAALGPLLDVVRASPRSTLVVATGDHGEGLGEHGEATHGLFAYEPTLKIPLIVADIPAGSRGTAALGAGEGGSRGTGEVAAAPAFHVDIVPTILDAVDMPVPSDLPGRSLRTAAARSDTTPRAAYFEAMSPSVEYGWAPLSGLVMSAEKYIELPIAELYDVGRDPHEANNIASAASNRARALSARLVDFHALRPSAPQAESAEAAARLRSLGYVAASAAPKARYTDADDPKRLVDLDRRMQDAAVLDAAGRLREAIPLYREALARRPDMIATARHLAFDYWRLGDADAAITTLQAALRAAGQSPGTEVQLGSYLLEHGRSTEAVALLEHAASAERSFDALSALALAYARLGRTADALRTLSKTLDVDPANAIAYENIGAVQLDAGNADEAKRAFERAVALNRGSSQGENGLALIAMRSGDRAAAIAHWKRAVEIQPANFDALYDLGVQLARDGQRDDAQRYLTQFARTAPPAQYAKELREVRSVLKDVSTQRPQRSQR